MGYDLFDTAGRHFRWRFVAWHKLMELAFLGGWRPSGTLPPEGWRSRTHGPWDGSYESSDGQLVTAEDSRSLADALDCMLPEIPDSPLPDQMVDYLEIRDFTRIPKKVREFIEVWQRSGRPGPVTGLDPARNVFEFFRQDGLRQVLQDFIPFCRAGAFRIW